MNPQHLRAAAAPKMGLDKDYNLIFCNSFIMKVSKGYRNGTSALESCTGSKDLVASLLLMPCKNCFHLPADGLRWKAEHRMYNCRICQINQCLKYPSSLHPITSLLPVACLIQDTINSIASVVALLTAQH